GILERDLAGLARAVGFADRSSPTECEQLSRRWRSPTLECTVARAIAGTSAARKREPVYGAAGWSGGAADAIGGGHGHPNRKPHRRADRQRAGRLGRVLCQHAGAADGCVGQSEFQTTAGASSKYRFECICASGSAVRAAGGRVEPGAVTISAPAVPGHGGTSKYSRRQFWTDGPHDQIKPCK